VSLVHCHIKVEGLGGMYTVVHFVMSRLLPCCCVSDNANCASAEQIMATVSYTVAVIV